MIDYLYRKLNGLEKKLNDINIKIERGNTLPFVAFVAQPVSATATIAHATNPRALTVITYKIALYVVTTNDGSNYWTVKLQTQDAGGAAADITNATVNTSAISADQYVVLSATVNTAVAAGVDIIRVRAEKTSSPGNLFWGAPIVTYR